MFAGFETYIREQAQLCDADIELIRSKSVEKTLRRKEFLLQQGEVCRYKVFISKGLLRAYSTSEDGSEHILQFSPENSWTTDPESFDKSTPSVCNIDALEYSEVILWSRNDFGYLINHIPGLKAFFGKLVSTVNYASRQRILSAISYTAEEKYEDFVKTYPHILARVPLHMVASYLGVTRETLSRIRHAQISSN